MLDSILAQELTTRIMKQLGYNINIMNEKGIIIASGDPQRIGDFHETAYRVITEKLDIEAIHSGDSKYIGVKPGVNMPILYNGQTIGVLGISGEPDNILEFAQIVKMTVETMVEYEFYKQQIQMRQAAKNVFLNALIYEEPIKPDRIKKLADELQYKESIVRVPIIIRIFSSETIDIILGKIKSSSCHTNQDISFDLGENHVMVFKTVPADSVSYYRKPVKKYLEEVNEILGQRTSNDSCYYYIGSPQKRFMNYRQAYQQLLWLEKHSADKNDEFEFFFEHISEYIDQTVPFNIFENMFSCYAAILDKLGKEFFNETAEALLENNMNTVKASQQLFVHRNTVIFRLNKIREALDIDPVNSMSDRQFLVKLLFYNKKRSQEKELY